MAITSGLYRVGSVPYPNEDGSYTNLLGFRNAATGGTLTGNLTAMVTSDVTDTATIVLGTINLAGYTLTIDNAAGKRFSHLNNSNKIIFDSTNVAAFHGFHFYSAAVSSDGTFVVKNQYFRRINSTLGSDIYLTAISSSYAHKLFVYDNIFDSVWGPDTSALYPMWLVDSTSRADKSSSYVHVYNNIFRGYKQSIIAQNAVAGSTYAYFYNNLSVGSIDSVFVNYATAKSFFWNNMGGNYGITDCTGWSNASLNTSVNGLKVGTNYPSVVMANQFDSTRFTDQNFFVPSLTSIALHKGVSDGFAPHTRYFNDLPIIPNDITIGPISRMIPPPIMVTT